MHTEYRDYSNHWVLKLCHKLGQIRYIPVRGSGKLTEILLKFLPIPHPKAPCIIETLHNFKVIVDPFTDKGIEKVLFLYGTYEEGTLRMMKHLLKDAKTFIDIGANIGIMSLYAAKIMNKKGKIWSFEPLTSTYNILTQNIKLNRFQNIRSENLAIGSRNESLSIYENININRGAASLIDDGDSKLKQSVKVIRLDHYLENNKINEPIDCIKIDVEGWELQVLKGATTILTSSNAPVCIIECSNTRHSFVDSAADMYSFLRDINSYRIFRLIRGKDKPSRLIEIKRKDALPKHDNLFCLMPY